MASTLRSTRKPRGAPGIDARGEFPDHTGTQHELMADDFSFSRGFPGREQVEVAGFHLNFAI